MFFVDSSAIRLALGNSEGLAVCRVSAVLSAPCAFFLEDIVENVGD